MKKIIVIILCVAGVCHQAAWAQGKMGFKTGLNFTSMKGPSEQFNGANLEEFTGVTGFHIGATYTYKFTDLFSLRGEFLYSRKGSKYAYKGEMYRKFTNTAGSVLTNGTGSYLVNISQSYLDIPLLAQVRYKKIELSAGIHAGIMVGASGQGSLQYNGKSLLGTSTGDLEFNLNHKYFGDEVGGGDGDDVNVTVDGRNYTSPKTLGAYYDSDADNGSLFNRLDVGLVGGLNYYINSTLYLGGRVQYGLVDITNNKVDFSRAQLDANGNKIYRTDSDKNFNIQVSIGFSF